MNRTLPGVLQFKQSIDRAIVLKRPLRSRAVELHHIEMIGLHATINEAATARWL
jgi:hypothetical protein